VFAGGVRGEGVTAAQAVPLPRQLDGVKVTVNGRDAPLYAVANVNGQEQVNFQVPWETEATTARIVVARDNTASPAVDVAVRALQPGIFELNGGGAIVVRTVDNTLVTAERPLGSRESVYLYATGLGPVDANPGTGNAGPRNPLARTNNPIGHDRRCRKRGAVLGPRPDFAIIYQVNILAPAGIGKANASCDLVEMCAQSRAN
jgi:uncharacterized protein (TIGR03437 family)